MLSYEVTRPGGVISRMDGDSSWEQLLTHEDVTKSGRILQICVHGARMPVVVNLEPDDILIFIRRTGLSLGDAQNLTVLGTRTLVGKKGKDGKESGCIIHSDGQVSWVPDTPKTAGAIATN